MDKKGLLKFIIKETIEVSLGCVVILLTWQYIGYWPGIIVFAIWVFLHSFDTDIYNFIKKRFKR